MRVLFFSGSGLSAGSGIPTFRGRGGLYAGMAAETVLSATMLRSNPDLVHGFHDDLRQLVADKQPNAAHRALADWQTRHPETTSVVTMNIDSLLEAAGCPKVVHLHGELRKLRSVGNRHITADIGNARYWSGPAGGEPHAEAIMRGQTSGTPVAGYQFRCPVSGSRFRPDVVLFEEAVMDASATYSYYPYGRALQALGPNDAIVVIGTRGNVIRVGHQVRTLPCRKMLVDPGPFDADYIIPEDFDLVLRQPAEEAAGAMVAVLEQWAAAPARTRQTGRYRLAW